MSGVHVLGDLGWYYETLPPRTSTNSRPGERTSVVVMGFFVWLVVQRAGPGIHYQVIQSCAWQCHNSQHSLDKHVGALGGAVF